MAPTVPAPDEVVRSMRTVVARLRLQVTEAANLHFAAALRISARHRHLRSDQLARLDPVARAA
jgi:hypothetical protein